MLKIVATVNNRQTLFLGLDRENTNQLHDDKPIAVDVQAMTHDLPQVQDVVLFASETIEEMIDELVRAGVISEADARNARRR